MKRFLADFASLFAIVFVLNAAVVWGWNAAFEGGGAFEWDTAFFFGFTIAAALAFLEHGPLARRRSV